MKNGFPALLLATGMLCGAAPAHPHPEPIQSLGVTRHGDGTLTLSWILPSDPSVVGLTVERERLDGRYDRDVFVIVGTPSDFTDGSARADRSYRYTVYTRDGAGNLSVGVWVEVFDLHGHDDHHHGSFWCHSSAGAGAGPAAWPALALLLAGLLAFRRRP